jgi:hypothetical protein
MYSKGKVSAVRVVVQQEKITGYRLVGIPLKEKRSWENPTPRVLV